MKYVHFINTLTSLDCLPILKVSLNISNGRNGSQAHLPLLAESEIALKHMFMSSVQGKLITHKLIYCILYLPIQVFFFLLRQILSKLGLANLAKLI